MENRAAKLALARKKLKDHQEKKNISVHKIEVTDTTDKQNCPKARIFHEDSEIPIIEYQDDDNIVNMTQCYAVKPNNNIFPDLNPESLNQPSDNVNVTEILISNKRNLELQVTELQSKLKEFDSNLRLEIMGHNDSKVEIKNLQHELENVNNKYKNSIEQIHQLNKKTEELSTMKSIMGHENNNLIEQLEFTKTVLTAKETENASLYSQINQIQSELDVSKLQIQQLINGSVAYTPQYIEDSRSSQSELLQKVENLEQQLKLVQKERDQINIHYEHYVGELNEQLKTASLHGEELSRQVHNLSNRESSLVEQISEMEIRIQNLQIKRMESEGNSLDKVDELNILQKEYKIIQEKLQDINNKYEMLQKLHIESETKVTELQDAANTKCNHDNISISKLTADIASDKIAAQRATEQNKKLKSNMQELEEAFVKMSQDKLDLTEKLTAEKYLNRELTIKLADSEEKFKDLHIKLRAKDDEMIRLQASYRDLESEFVKYTNTSMIPDIAVTESNEKLTEEIAVASEYESTVSHSHDSNCPKAIYISNENDNHIIPKEDAMLKLQERFLKIMDEVADLSDEKHRLEHIILQLQNETDTICEYVALYQQQRSLLNRRDEERSTQIKLFQIECDRLKRQLEELSGILLKFAEDKELSTYFQVESRQRNMEKARSLLLNLKKNTLIDPKRNNLELKNIYPCNCCSGKLIDI